MFSLIKNTFLNCFSQKWKHCTYSYVVLNLYDVRSFLEHTQNQWSQCFQYHNVSYYNEAHLSRFIHKSRIAVFKMNALRDLGRYPHLLYMTSISKCSSQKLLYKIILWYFVMMPFHESRKLLSLVQCNCIEENSHRLIKMILCLCISKPWQCWIQLYI